MSSRHASVAHTENSQIFQYDMAFYLGNIEMNFIGRGIMKRSKENSAIFGIFPSMTPQINTYLQQSRLNYTFFYKKEVYKKMRLKSSKS